jgi:predicted nucleic acid-binding Zn ribbon protein
MSNYYEIKEKKRRRKTAIILYSLIALPMVWIAFCFILGTIV